MTNRELYRPRNCSVRVTANASLRLLASTCRRHSPQFRHVRILSYRQRNVRTGWHYADNIEVSCLCGDRFIDIHSDPRRRNCMGGPEPGEFSWGNPGLLQPIDWRFQAPSATDLPGVRSKDPDLMEPAGNPRRTRTGRSSRSARCECKRVRTIDLGRAIDRDRVGRLKLMGSRNRQESFDADRSCVSTGSWASGSVRRADRNACGRRRHMGSDQK